MLTNLHRATFKYTLFVLPGLFCFSAKAYNQDNKKWIFLCFGQSNMEDNAKFEPQDTIVDSRFQVMEAVDCSNLGREKGKWYTAVPPLCRCKTGDSTWPAKVKAVYDNLLHDLHLKSGEVPLHHVVGSRIHRIIGIDQDW